MTHAWRLDGTRGRSAWLVAGALVAAGMASSGCSGGAQRCAAPTFDTQGHRGARSYRPENTLPAFEYALTRGVHTLELDLAVTSDDVLVVSHDPWLLPEKCLDPDGRPADRVPIRSLTLAQVQRFDCGSQTLEEFPDQQPVPGTPPPSLLSVLATADARSGGAIRYNIEIKSDPSWGSDLTPDPERFVDLTLTAVATAGVQDRVTLQSFDPRPLRVLRDRGNTLRRALLWPSAIPSIHGELLRNDPVEAATLLGCDILAPFAPLTRAPLVAAAHGVGLWVIPWTVNEKAELERLMDLGVDGIISDDADLMVQTARERRPSGGVCF